MGVKQGRAQEPPHAFVVVRFMPNDVLNLTPTTKDVLMQHLYFARCYAKLARY